MRVVVCAIHLSPPCALLVGGGCRVLCFECVRARVLFHTTCGDRLGDHTPAQMIRRWRLRGRHPASASVTGRQLAEPASRRESEASDVVDEHQSGTAVAATSDFISVAERNAAYETELSLASPSGTFFRWRDVAPKLFDSRNRACHLCDDHYSVLETGWRAHVNLPQHQAREGLALEMLRRNRGRPPSVVSRWWHLLEDGHPVAFRRIDSLSVPAPGTAAQRLSRPAAAVGALSLRSPVLEHGIESGSVDVAALASALEQRGIRVRRVLQFLRSAGVLRGCFGQRQHAGTAHEDLARGFDFQRLEWIGDNMGKFITQDRMNAIFPPSEGGMRGRLGMVNALLDSNEALTRAFDFLKLNSFMSDVTTAGGKLAPKFKADFVEALIGELAMTARSAYFRWGRNDELFPCVGPRSLAAVKSLAEHCMNEIAHLMMMHNIVHVLVALTKTLDKLGMAIDDDKTRPFAPVDFNPDTFVVTRRLPAERCAYSLSHELSEEPQRRVPSCVHAIQRDPGAARPYLRGAAIRGAFCYVRRVPFRHARVFERQHADFMPWLTRVCTLEAPPLPRISRADGLHTLAASWRDVYDEDSGERSSAHALAPTPRRVPRAIEQRARSSAGRSVWRMTRSLDAAPHKIIPAVWRALHDDSDLGGAHDVWRTPPNLLAAYPRPRPPAAASIQLCSASRDSTIRGLTPVSVTRDDGADGDTVLAAMRFIVRWNLPRDKSARYEASPRLLSTRVLCATDGSGFVRPCHELQRAGC